MAPPRFAAPGTPTRDVEPSVAVIPGAGHDLRARRFLLLLLGVNGAVMAVALGAGAIAPAAEAAGHAGGDFLAWCSTLR